MRGGRRTKQQKRPIVPDVGTHVPYLVGSISNHLATTSSILYRTLFDIGLTEWRLMWVLAIDPHVTAQTASQKVGLDKAAASRAIAGLARRGLLRITNNPTDSRERMLRLSPKGEALYKRMIVIAKERERILLEPLAKAEIPLLVDFLKRLDQQAAKVRALGPDAFKDLAGGKAGKRNKPGTRRKTARP
jgi:DNA-binding MarR family transcriptional regulator